MKKIFLSLLAIFAMVGMANAQRAWAYDLGLGYESDTYTFTFKATTAANATLIFTDAEGTELATHDAGAVVAGTNTVALTKEQLPEGTEIHWAVKLTGDAIAAGTTLKELNSKLFYNMMGIVADKNPESNDFGKVYMQMAYDGKPTYGDAKQTQGFFIFDPIFNLLNTDANAGVKPTLPAGYTFDGSNRLQFHRVDIDPKTGNLVFCYSVADKPGVFSVSRDNLTGDVANLLAGVTGIEDVTRTNALCFDEDGVLYVIANVTTSSTKGNIYKIADGVATKLTLKDTKIWIDEQVGLVSDGRGGLWVAQNRYGITQNSALFHVNVAKDSIDFVLETGKEYSDWFTGNNCRGGIAYNTKEDLLAVHGAAAASLFKVTYDAETGVPTITKWLQATTGGKNTDAIAFDYAGDLYTGNSSGEYFKKFEVPTTNNSCTTPAPKAQVIVNSNAVVTYAISVTANDPAMGTVTGGGVYYPDETVTLTATPNEGHKFVNWSNGSTDNPLIFTATEDVELTANFEAFTYTITVASSDETKGTVAGGGTYAYNTTATLTATANEGYEFVNWSNGSTENPLTMTVTSEETLTANFRQVLATSITLNALPVQDYTPAIKGTIKRAVQNGENTIVLTHEADGTAHIYNIAHATQTVIEISQEGVNAAADGYLAISDIAVTDDGKLVACNYVHCTFTPSNTSYFYIWNDLAGDPTVWFTSQKSGNYNDAYMGYTMALKGTSQNAEVTISAFNKNNNSTRYSHLYVVDGAYADANYKYSRDNAALHPNTLGRNTYELNASPLAAGKWIVDGELASPIEFVEKNAVAIDTYTALNSNVLGKKYNGASYLKNYNDHYFMIAPYANEEGLLAGVKVIGITDGFAAPTVLATNTALDVAVEATTAAATAVVDAEGNLTIHLFADAQVYTFTQKEPEISYETFVLSNLIIEDNESYWLLNASDNMMGLSVMLGVNAEDASIMEGSTILFGETELPILSSEPLAWGYNEELAVDTYTARVVVDFMGGKMGLELVMYATLGEPIDLIATDAICVYDENSQILHVNAIWEEKNIQLEIAGVEYVSEKTYGESWLTIAVGEEDEYFVVGEPTVVIDGNTFVLTGKFINYEGKHPDHNVTISGTLPGNLTTALDNIDATIAPVKAIVNGQLVITKDGVQYNAAGAIIK